MTIAIEAGLSVCVNSFVNKLLPARQTRRAGIPKPIQRRQRAALLGRWNQLVSRGVLATLNHLLRYSLLAAITAAAGRNHGDGVRQQGHLAGALDGVRDVVLMLRASASDATGLDLAAVGHVLTEELPQAVHVARLGICISRRAQAGERCLCWILARPARWFRQEM